MKSAIAWVTASVCLLACDRIDRVPTAPSVPAQDAGPAPGADPPIDTVVRVVAAMTGDLRQCYNDALARDATVAGKVVVAAMIDVRGTVLSALSEGETTLPPEVVACITARIAKAKFPARREGTTLRIPLSFKPE